MQTINLKQYYPFCTEDTFIEVSDEIVEAFLNCSGGSMRRFPLCPQRRPAASMPGICWG